MSDRDDDLVVVLERRVKQLEDQLELFRLDIELMHRKTCKDIRRMSSYLEAHRGILLDLKPVYDEFRNRKIESLREVDRIYG